MFDNYPQEQGCEATDFIRKPIRPVYVAGPEMKATGNVAERLMDYIVGANFYSLENKLKKVTKGLPF